MEMRWPSRRQTICYEAALADRATAPVWRGGACLAAELRTIWVPSSLEAHLVRPWVVEMEWRGPHRTDTIYRIRRTRPRRTTSRARLRGRPRRRWHLRARQLLGAICSHG